MADRCEAVAPPGAEPDDLAFVRDFVRSEAGIAIEASKGYLIEARLASLIRGLEGVSSLAELVAQLRGPAAASLRDRVIEAIATHETSFFRDERFFEVLREIVLPETIERRKAERRLDIWSAAVSSGQEAYSIAILIREHFPELSNWRIRIHATDISESILRRLREASYSQLEVARGLPRALLAKYFCEQNGRFVVIDSLRSMVVAKRLNLVKRPWPPLPPMDLVLLRNVLIYFDADTRKRVLEDVRGVMCSDCVLLLGSCEDASRIDPAFERRDLGGVVGFRVSRGRSPKH